MNRAHRDLAGLEEAKLEHLRVLEGCGGSVPQIVMHVRLPAPLRLGQRDAVKGGQHGRLKMRGITEVQNDAGACGRTPGAEHQMEQYWEVRLGEAATDFKGDASGIQIHPHEDTQFVIHSILQEKVRKPTA